MITCLNMQKKKAFITLLLTYGNVMRVQKDFIRTVGFLFRKLRLKKYCKLEKRSCEKQLLSVCRKSLFFFEKKNQKTFNFGHSKIIIYSILHDGIIIRTKSFGQAFSKACGFQRQSLWSHSAECETPCLRGAFTRGELKNSPVGCFSRGDALQEKASPYFGRTQTCLPI